jgi:two-component system, NarL family, nitrate/nitrite sensor histidine kinase NarX
VTSLPLFQPSGWRIGQAIIVEDVTQARQAQHAHAQLQWAQATLEERELLADELHDNFSQNLAFLNLQAQAAQLYLETGQGETAQASLDRLAEAVGEIQEDTREMIDHLLSVSKPAENFCVTLHQMLKGFETQSGLATQLYLSGEAAKEDCYDPTRLPPPVAVQLVRITQEALTNVRKHAHGSSQVIVKLKATDKLMEMTITDDGAGFQQGAERTDGKHFGLQIMHQRVTRIGGQITVESTQGAGTRIKISVPLGANGSGSSG